MKCTCNDDFPAEVICVREPKDYKSDVFSVCRACKKVQWHSRGLFSATDNMTCKEADAWITQEGLILVNIGDE